MKLYKINIRTFRCFRDYSIEFSPRVTVLFGKNGVGKTTIIHAIHKALSFMMYPDNIYESVKSKGKKSKRKIQDGSMDDLNVYLSLLTPQMWDVTLKYSFFKTI